MDYTASPQRRRRGWPRCTFKKGAFGQGDKQDWVKRDQGVKLKRGDTHQREYKSSRGQKSEGGVGSGWGDIRRRGSYILCGVLGSEISPKRRKVSSQRDPLGDCRPLAGDDCVLDLITE